MRYCLTCGRVPTAADRFELIAGKCPSCLDARAHEIRQKHVAVAEPEIADAQLCALSMWIRRPKRQQVRELERLYAVEA
jgi:hypothetical protein